MCRIAHDKSIACSTPVFKIQRAKVYQNILRQHALLGQARRAPVGREAVQINAAHGCLRRGQALRLSLIHILTAAPDGNTFTVLFPVQD